MSTEAIEKLKSLVSTIDRLSLETDRVLMPKPSETKRIPLFASQSVIFRYPELTTKQRTFVNEAEDFYITKLGFTVHTMSPGTVIAPAPTPAPVTLSDQEIGLGIQDTAVDNAFDFVWNYGLVSTGQQYMSPANNSFLTSRKSLGNKERGRFLEFDASSPLCLKAGDALMFTVRSILYPIPVVSAFADAGFSASVNMFMIGYRTGKMADSAYDFRKDIRSAK